MKKVLKTGFILIMALMLSLCMSACDNDKNNTESEDDYVSSSYLALDLDEYIKLPENYMDFDWEEPEIEVTDEMVENSIALTLADSTVDTRNDEGKIKDGDKIKITYEAKNEAGEVAASNDAGYTVIMGKDYITGDLEDALIGHKVGDTVKVESLVADDFEKEELAGTKVTYYITITEKYDVQEAEFNEEWVKENSDCETIEEYKAQTREALYDQLYDNALDELYTEKFEAIVDEAKQIKDSPEDIIKEEADYFEGYVYYYGYQNYGIDIDSMSQEYAVTTSKEKMVLYKIAQENDLIPTVKEFTVYCSQVAASQGYDEKSFMDTFVYNSYEYGLKFGWLEEYLDQVVEKQLLEGKSDAFDQTN